MARRHLEQREEDPSVGQSVSGQYDTSQGTRAWGTSCAACPSTLTSYFQLSAKERERESEVLMSTLTLNGLLNTPSHKPIRMIKMASTVRLFLCVCACTCVCSKHLYVLCVTFCKRQHYFVVYAVGQSLTLSH